MSHVEFLGLPGSGKSSIYRAVLAGSDSLIGLDDAVRSALRREGHDPITRAAARLSRSAESRLWKAAYGRSADRFRALTDFAAAHPEMLRSVAEATGSRADETSSPSLGWVLNLMARYQLAVASPAPGTLLIDEGFLQRSVALFAHPFAASIATLERYVASVPGPAVVLHVETPVDVCRRRLDDRGWSERVAVVGDRASFLADAEKVVGLVRQIVADRFRIVTLDGARPVDVNAAAALEHLRR